MSTKIGMLNKLLDRERTELSFLVQQRELAQTAINESMEAIQQTRRRILHEERHGDPEDYT